MLRFHLIILLAYCSFAVFILTPAIAQPSADSPLLFETMKVKLDPVAVLVPVSDVVVASQTTSAGRPPIQVDVDLASLRDWVRLKLDLSRSAGERTEGLIKIFDSNHQLVWTAAAATLFPEGWTPNLYSAEFSISTTSPDTAVTVTKVMLWRTPSIPQSAVGLVNLKDLQQLGELKTTEAAQGVVLIEYETTINDPQAGEIEVSMSCTGFHVAPRVVITNAHCVSDRAAVESARVYFDYVKEPRPLSFVGVRRVVDISEAFDAALLELASLSDDSSVPTFRGLSSSPKQLRLVQQFEGKHIQVSFDDECVSGSKVSGPYYRNNSGSLCTLEEIAFEHGCDTENRSSGSAVLDSPTGAVVGLHFWGHEGSKETLNRAIDIGPLACWILDSADSQGANIEAVRDDLISACRPQGSETCWP